MRDHTLRVPHRHLSGNVSDIGIRCGGSVMSAPHFVQNGPDSTRIVAVFDLQGAPHGLYDVTVINPGGQWGSSARTQRGGSTRRRPAAG